MKITPSFSIFKERNSDMKNLILIDAHNLAYRMLFGFKTGKQELSSSGKETSIIYGFVRQILSLMKDYQNSDVIICWDCKSKRRIALTNKAKAEGLIKTGYKEERQSLSEADKETLSVQMAYLKTEILPKLAVCQISVDGYEADDVIFSYVKKYKEHACYIVSSDRDFYQALSMPNVQVIDCINHRVWTKEKFMEEYGFDPNLYVDYGAFVGEGGGGDNIPGVPNCGDKTARKFVKEYGNVEAIISALQKKETRTFREESVLKNLTLLGLSYELKKMDYIELPDYSIQETDVEETKKMLVSWGFISFLKNANVLCRISQD